MDSIALALASGITSPVSPVPTTFTLPYGISGGVAVYDASRGTVFYGLGLQTVNTTTTGFNAWTIDAATPAVTSGTTATNSHVWAAHVGDGAGRVFVIGGSTTNATAGGTLTVDVYNAATPGWTNLAAAPRLHTLGAAAYYAGKIYAFGGWPTSGSSYTNATSIYTISSNTWSTGATHPKAATDLGMANVAVCISGTTIYILCSDATLWAYNIAGNSFSQLASRPIPVSGMNPNGANTKAFDLLAGPDGLLYSTVAAAPFNDPYIPITMTYDPALNVWTPGPSAMFASRMNAPSVVAGNRVVRVSGFPQTSSTAFFLNAEVIDLSNAVKFRRNLSALKGYLAL
jgi:hypothetical protein